MASGVLLDLRQKKGTFDADKTLHYIRAHWENLDGKPSTFNPATHDNTHDTHNDGRYAPIGALPQNGIINGIISIRSEDGAWHQKIETADTVDLNVHRFTFHERQGAGSYIELFGVDGNGEIYAKGNKVYHPNNKPSAADIGALSAVPNDHVTNARLANVPTLTVKGRVSAGTGDPQDLTMESLKTILTYAFSDLTSHPTTLSEYGITDARTATEITGEIATAVAGYAAKTNSVYFVQGNFAGTAGIWTGTISDISALYVGLSIDYQINTAGASTTTLNINSYGPKTVRRNNGNLTTHLPVGTIVHLVYDGTYWVWADYDSNTTYSAMTVGDGELGSSTASRLMRADYLKSITEYRVNNMGIVNPNGGTLGGLAFTQNYTVSVPSGGYKWVKLFTVSNLSVGKVTMTLGGTTTQQSMTIEFKNSHYTEACGLIVSTQSYNPIVSKVIIYGANGGDKSLYVYVDANGYSRSITYNMHDVLGTILSIDNSVLAGAPSGTASMPVDLPYEGNITVSNGAFYATTTNVWGTLSHRVSASIEPAKSNGFKQTFIYTGTGTRTIRIPANSSQAFPIGTEFVIINYNTGPTAFAPDGGVTLNGSSVFPTYTTRYRPMKLIKVDTDAWVGEYSA